MGTYIFISYGHDAYVERAQLIYEHLNKEEDNFVIWWDRKLKYSDDWVWEIDRHLNELINHKPNSCFVYMVTPHSANTDRDNFCIKEIAKVVEGKVRVIPVKLVDAPMPLLLSNIQWMDLSDIQVDEKNNEFLRRIERLRQSIKEGVELPRDGKQEIIRSKLEPCNFSLDLEKHLKNYEPRQWLLDTVEQWIKQSDSPLLLLLGGPGTGKTAFSIWMSYCELSQYVAAWHLCQYNDMRTCSLRTAVKSIAYYLASRLPAYYELLNIAQIDKVLSETDLDAGTLFKALILEKLQQVEHDGTLVILIDALDEASRDNYNGLAETIARYSKQLPKWMKIIITSRNDPTITTHLADCSTIINLDDVDSSRHSSDDIGRYVERMIGKDSSAVRLVVSESGNNFLYAQLLCNSIRENPGLSSDSLPNGINSYYSNYLRRYFRNQVFEFNTHALPLLNIILTAYEPLGKRDVFDRLHETCEWCTDFSKFCCLVKCFGPLLKESDDSLLPFHKSLSDWFLDNKNNSDFSVYRIDGLRELIRWGCEVVADEFPDKDERLTNHFYHYLPRYMIEARDKSFVKFYANLDFWQRRQLVLGVNETLRLLMEELALCKTNVRTQLYASEQFFNVLNYFNIDLFNTGRYTNLHRLGYSIPLTSGMDDNRRLFAIRYLYINELFNDIDSNVCIFEEPYKDHAVEAMLMNELGQTYRKFGQLERSAEFYKISLDNARKYNGTLDEVIYTLLNLSRISTLQCRDQEARQLLREAEDLFNSGVWRDSMQGADSEFSAQQLARGVYFVALETEIYSLNPDYDICRSSLKWADEVYEDPNRRDRYYPNHLISKVLYCLRIGHVENIESLIEECRQNITGNYDEIRLDYLEALYYVRRGLKDDAYRIVTARLDYLMRLDIHMIQRAEYLSLLDYLSGTDRISQLPEELVPWYDHIQSIIKRIVCGVLE